LLTNSALQPIWNFQVVDSYSSNLHLNITYKNAPVPMEWNPATEQLIRVLPGALVYEDDSSSSSSSSTSTENTSSLTTSVSSSESSSSDLNISSEFNVLQAFNENLTRRHERLIEARGCPVTGMNIRTYPDASSSRCCPKLKSQIVTACNGFLVTYDYPSCKVPRCMVAASDLIRIYTSASGETFALFPTALVVYDGNCNVVRSSGDFCLTPSDCLAVDFVLDEANGVAIVGLVTLEVLIFDMNDLSTTVVSTSLPGAANVTPFVFYPSAILIPGFIVFRAYLNGLNYLFYYGNAVLNSAVVPNEVDGKRCVGKCIPVDEPLVINDYFNHIDILVSRNCKKHQLYFSVSYFDNGVKYQCSNAKIPECIHGKVQPTTGAKHPLEDSFYVGFMPSNDLVHVTYEGMVPSIVI